MNKHRITAGGVALSVALLGGAIFNGHFKHHPAPEPVPVVTEEVVAPAPEPVVKPVQTQRPRATRAQRKAERQAVRTAKPAKPVAVPVQEPARRPPQGQRMTAREPALSVRAGDQTMQITCADVKRGNATLSDDRKAELRAKATLKQKAFAATCLHGI